MPVSIPYGWIGNRPESCKADYDETKEIFDCFVRPYLAIYCKALYLLKSSSVRILEEMYSDLTIVQTALGSLVHYCNQKLYFNHVWLQVKGVDIPTELTSAPRVAPAQILSDYRDQRHIKIVEDTYDLVMIRRKQQEQNMLV